MYDITIRDLSYAKLSDLFPFALANYSLPFFLYLPTICDSLFNSDSKQPSINFHLERFTMFSCNKVFQLIQWNQRDVYDRMTTLWQSCFYKLRVPRILTRRSNYFS